MQDLTQENFGQIATRVAQHALTRPDAIALVEGDRRLRYAELDVWMDQIASALQREGCQAGDAIAICAASSMGYAAVFLGALRAGVVVAPLAPSSSTAGLWRMVADAQAKLLFTDQYAADVVVGDNPVKRIALDGSAVGQSLHSWMAAAGTKPQAVDLGPDAPFNIIYSSGTTGDPKGIVQSHGMRWGHVRRGASYGYSANSVTLLSTPLYSNTTLVAFFPTISFGGTVVLMPKFDALGYLKLAQAVRATHTMLVPVQYQRLMSHPEFDRFDLSSFCMKFSTSAPFGARLKADVLARWPGGLTEMYGMTEGGGTCILEAHRYPDKLHTVGKPAEGHDIRLIDDDGREALPGEAGEVVGASPMMMTGYHGQPEKTRDAEWFDTTGKRFIRTGDVGRFDADGFLTLFDRKKDMIISGGFNVYPSDLEAVLLGHPAVLESSVIGVPSELWGETPLAFVVLKPGQMMEASSLLQWFSERVGKTQRLSGVRFLEALPRSAIGKVLKRELREAVMSQTP